MKAVGQKRPKLKALSSETSKRPKVQSKMTLKPQIDLDKISKPSQIPPPNKKSVKTINSGSCIRQFSRPIVPPQAHSTRGPAKTVKTLPPLLPPAVSKPSDKVSKPSKSKTKASAKKVGRVFSSRSLGLVDFEKIRTTARTRNMAPGSRSLPDLSCVGFNDKRPSKSKPEKQMIPKAEPCDEVEEKIVETSHQFTEGPSASTACNGTPNSATDSPGRISQNGVNKEVKSFLILKVMPIVSLIRVLINKQICDW